MTACLLGAALMLSLTSTSARSASVVDPGSWPTLHGNAQRFGYYPDFPQPPFKLAWRKELHRELTGPRCEVIGGGDLVFMGTYAGNLYAFDAHSGDERWRFHTAGPIGHSPALHNGVLYFASMDRGLYAADAATGVLRWRFEASEGFWNSPLVLSGLVLIGARDGVFYAVDAATGELRWKLKTGTRIVAPASATSDGLRAVFVSEDMHVYCIRVADGRPLWKSEKLHGLSARDHAPLIAEGLVFVTTNPVKDFHSILDEQQSRLLRWASFEGEDDRYIPGTAEDIRREQDLITRYLETHPSEQTFYAFQIDDGRQPWVAPIFYTGGLHNPLAPPCYNPRTGEIFVFVRSAYGVWDGGGEVRPYTGVGKLNPASGKVTLIEHEHRSKDPLRPAGRKDMPWMSFNTIGDETQTLSCSDRFLLSNHQGYLGSMEFATGLCRNLYGKRDTYGGFYGPGNFGWEKDGGVERARQAGEPFGIVNEWHGPAKAIISVINQRVYFPVGSQIICLEPVQ